MILITVTEHAPTIRGLKHLAPSGTRAHTLPPRDGTRPDNQGIETQQARAFRRKPRVTGDGTRPDNQGIETASSSRLSKNYMSSRDGTRPDNQGIETWGTMLCVRTRRPA